MKNNYILIDYENVQRPNLDLLIGHSFNLIVFVGANQKSIPFDLVTAMQKLGDQVEYKKISGNGSNALDFHIAFYMGEIASKDEDAYFHVISRDTGFDPLITHLRKRKILALRHEEIERIPFVRAANAKVQDGKSEMGDSDLKAKVPTQPEKTKKTSAKAQEEKIGKILSGLKARGPSRPKSAKTLASTIHAQFAKALASNELEGLMTELVRRKHIVISGQSVSYGPAVVGP